MNSSRQQAHLVVIGLSVGGVLMVLLATAAHGIGASPDSISYLSTAQNLLNGRGFVQYDGTLYLQWPPLIPMVVAVLGSGRIGLLDVFRYSNALWLGLTAYSAGRWLLSNLHSLPLSLLGSVAVLLSPALVLVSLWALSDAFFVLLTLICLFDLGRFLRDGRRRYYLLAVLFAALALLTRYAGLAVVAAGMLALAFRPGAGRAQKLVDSVLFGIASSMPAAAWAAGNYLASSSSAGVRVDPAASLGENINRAVVTLGAWFLPDRIGGASWVFVIVLSGVLAAGLVVRGSDTGPKRRRLLALIPLALFVGIYLVYLLLAASVTALDPIDDRLLAPLAVPLVLITFSAIDALGERVGRTHDEKKSSFVAFAAAAFLFTFPMGYSAAELRVTYADGLGFSTAGWSSSALVHWLPSVPDGALYTNEPEGVFLFTGIVAERSPRTVFYGSTTPTDDLVKLRQTIDEKGIAYLAWFEYSNWPNLVGLDVLGREFDLQPKIVTWDGTIYALTPK